MEQVRQLVDIALCISPLEERDPGVGDMFYCLFVELNCPLSYIMAGSYFWMLVTSIRRKESGTSFKLVTTPIIVEVLLFFHLLQFVITKHQKYQLVLPFCIRSACAFCSLHW